VGADDRLPFSLSPLTRGTDNELTELHSRSPLLHSTSLPPARESLLQQLFLLSWRGWRRRGRRRRPPNLLTQCSRSPPPATAPATPPATATAATDDARHEGGQARGRQRTLHLEAFSRSWGRRGHASESISEQAVPEPVFQWWWKWQWEWSLSFGEQHHLLLCCCSESLESEELELFFRRWGTCDDDDKCEQTTLGRPPRVSFFDSKPTPRELSHYREHRARELPRAEEIET
jgi:hypothetical protein